MQAPEHLQVNPAAIDFTGWKAISASLCAVQFCVDLTQARVIREEGTSAEKRPPRDLLVSIFLISAAWLQLETPVSQDKVQEQEQAGSQASLSLGDNYVGCIGWNLSSLLCSGAQGHSQVLEPGQNKRERGKKSLHFASWLPEWE